MVRRSLSWALAGGCAMGLMLLPSTAMAELKMTWDCYLPGASVDCGMLENSLTSKMPFLRVVRNKGDADVAVTVTSVPAEDGTRFELGFVGKRVDGYATQVQTSDKTPSSIDATTAIVRIMTKLERGLAQYLDQKTEAQMINGRLDIQVMDPVRAPYTGRPEQSGLKWYVAPAVGTYFSQVDGVGVNASGNASIFFNYSAPRWRVEQWLGGNYSHQSQPVPGTAETASIQFSGGSASNVFSWSLTPDARWSAGLMLSAEKNPEANYDLRANGSMGVEFDLIPIQTVNQRNFGFRCALGPEFERFDATNVQGVDSQAVGRQFCDVFLNWHFLPLDLSGTVGETTLVEGFDYRSFSGGLSATWRLTDNLTISPWASVRQVHDALNEARPVTAAYTDPRQEIEASMLAAVEQGYTAPFGVQSGLTVRFLFGNGSLASEDQRWKNVSNLR